jgi:hypothetical protein
LFSSDTEEAAGAEEISPEQPQSIPDSIKFKLQGMLQLHEQVLDVLVQDVGPVQSILAKVKNSLVHDLALVLAPAAYIEGFQHLISKARSRIADRVACQGQKERDRAHTK